MSVPRLSAKAGWFVVTLTFLAPALLAAEPVPLGHQDFRPSPERPVGWRGDGTGCYPGAKPVTRWDEKTGENLLWKLALPFGYGQPIVVGGLVFTQADPDALIAVEANSGRIAWQSTEKTVTREEEKQGYRGWFNWYGLTYPTPVSDGEHVCAKSGGSLACYTLKGRQVWRKPVAGAEADKSVLVVQSPLLAGGRLVYLTPGEGKAAQALVGLDPKTGEQLWRTPLGPDLGTEARGSGPPVLVRFPEADVLLTRGGDAVRARDGKLLASGLHTVAEGYRPFCWTFTTAVDGEHNLLVRSYPPATDSAYKGGELCVTAVRLRLDPASPDRLLRETLWGPKPIEAAGGQGPKLPTQIQHVLASDGRWYLQGWPDLITLSARDGRTLDWKQAPKEMRGHMVWHEFPTTHLAGAYTFIGDRNGTVGVYEAGDQWRRVIP